MLAETLALALALASTGTPRALPGIDPQPDNATRARRGLLPRKVPRARPPSRARRVVLLPPAPTWLGEPGEPVEAAPAVAAAPVLDLAVEAASAQLEAPGLETVAAAAGDPPAAGAVASRVEPVCAGEPAADGPPPLRAAVQGAEVELLLVHRFAEPAPPEVAVAEPAPREVAVAEPARPGAVQATLAEPELLVVVVRRPPAAGR